MTPHEQFKASVIAEIDKMQADNEKNIRAAMGDIKHLIKMTCGTAQASRLNEFINDVTFSKLEIQL